MSPAACPHRRHWTAGCAPRATGCEHDHYCEDCGAHVGTESWNFGATAKARADHDATYNSVDIPATVCETRPMPRKKRESGSSLQTRETAASVLDELTIAADSAVTTVTERLTSLVPLVRSAQAAHIPVPAEVLQQVPTLTEIVAEYKTRHERAADDEKALKVLRAAVLETLDDPTWNTTGTDDAPGDGFVLRRKGMPGRDKLDVVLLVQKGVDPAVIAECTVAGDPYFELRVVVDKAAAE